MIWRLGFCIASISRRKGIGGDRISTSDQNHSYVDEAGDPILFGSKRGSGVIIGDDGCSKFFIMGKLEVADPERLSPQDLMKIAAYEWRQEFACATINETGNLRPGVRKKKNLAVGRPRP